MSDKKKENKRCALEGCNKKVKITDLLCRCGNKYCQLHRIPETHDCSFNFKNIDKENFMKKCGLGGGTNKKINVI